MAAETAIKSLSPAQLKYFNKENTGAKSAAFFDPVFFTPPLIEEEKIKVGVAVDIGGSTSSWASFCKINGRLIQSTETVIRTSQNSVEDLLWLEYLAKKTRSLPVGISTTGSILGTKWERTNNLPLFREHLVSSYHGDFAEVFLNASRLAVLNDAVAGAMGTLYDLTLSEELPSAVKNAVYLINGSGINAAVWREGQLWSTELGAIQIDPQLAESMELAENATIRQTASGSGIRTRYKNETGQDFTGEEISQHSQNGNKTASRILEDSAYMAAHIVAGLGQDFDLFETAGSTLLICHGGVFSAPDYIKRVRQYLKGYFGYYPLMVVTGNGKNNPGLKGAALAALSG